MALGRAHVPGLILTWKILDCTGGDIYVERGVREPITGVWGQSPQRGPGAEPLVRGSDQGGKAPPLKLRAF